MIGVLRRAAVCFAALVAVVGLTPATATADTVRLDYRCVHYYGTQLQTFLVTITAPATAGRGATVTLGATISGITPRGTALRGGPSPAILDIHLGGANSGTVIANGFSYPDSDADDPFQLVGGQARVTLPNTGDTTFRPGIWRYPNVFFSCDPGANTPVAATTRVS